MVKGTRTFLFGLLLAAVMAGGGAVWAETVQIQILQTSDIHSRLVPDETHSGSFLQLAQRIHSQAESFGRDKSLLIDCGDSIQGSLVASVSQGKAGVDAILSMGYDVWVPGNHEFDFGIEKFFEIAEPLRPITLCGNLHPVKAAPYAAWKMFEKGGARIAVIGAAASYMRHWFIGDIEKICRVEMAVVMLERILPEVLAQKPDMIVLAIHQGIMQGLDVRNVNEIYAIAKKYPEIDLILGGHTHLDIAGRTVGARSWYVQPGAGADCFSIITATIDTDKHEMTDIQSFLRFADAEETPYYPPMAEAVQKWLQIADEKAQEVISPSLAYELSPSGTPGISCQVSEMISMAMVEATGADCALHGTLSSKRLEAGKAVLFADVYDLIPYENEVMEAWITAEELGEIALEQWSRRAGYSYSGIYGAFVTIFSSAEDASAVVTGWGKEKKPTENGRRYKLVLNSFTAAGSGRYPKLREILDRTDTKLRNTGLSVRKVVAEYLKKHHEEAIQPVRWMKTSKKK